MFRPLSPFALLLAVLATGLLSTVVRVQPFELPQGLGLSSLYPGDVGIQNDPAVLFTENFKLLA